MRIVYIYSSFAQWGGLERVLVDKMNALVACGGYDIWLLTSDQGDHTMPYALDARIHWQDLGVRFHIRYRHRGLRRLLEYFRLSRYYQKRMAKALRQIQPDLLVCTTAGQICQLLSVKGSVPLVVECHVNFLHPGTWLQRLRMLSADYYAGKADAVVTLSEGDARNWRRVSRHVHVIPNVVHLGDSAHKSSCEAPRAVYVGRFTTQKNLYELMAAWQVVNSRYPDWQLHMYGDGEQWQAVSERAAALGSGIHVHHHAADVMQVYRDSSLLLLTSVYEPFGLVIAEAMSCGLPVVAYDSPYGPAQMVADGENGYLVSIGDTAAFASRVCQLIADADLRRQMGLAGIQTAQRYSADNIMPQWKQLFGDLTAR
ncbi:MAG: glycosyltransferase [Prevotella sp.]|nr:glycosyltransferase [Prevotella sp.]